MISRNKQLCFCPYTLSWPYSLYLQSPQSPYRAMPASMASPYKKMSNISEQDSLSPGRAKTTQPKQRRSECLLSPRRSNRDSVASRIPIQEGRWCSFHSCGDTVSLDLAFFCSHKETWKILICKGEVLMVVSLSGTARFALLNVADSYGHIALPSYPMT